MENPSDTNYMVDMKVFKAKLRQNIIDVEYLNQILKINNINPKLDTDIVIESDNDSDDSIDVNQYLFRDIQMRRWSINYYNIHLINSYAMLINLLPNWHLIIISK